MVKNFVAGFLIGALIVLVVLIAMGKLVWNDSLNSDPLEKAIEMHTPKVIEIGNTELLWLPNTQQLGNKISIDYKFYVYENGQLKEAKLK